MASPTTTRRDLERWVATHRQALAAVGVRVQFSFGPSVGQGDGASWASFTSARGAGRLIRDASGSSGVDVYAHPDGGCLLRERDVTATGERLAAIADLLSASRRAAPPS